MASINKGSSSNENLKQRKSKNDNIKKGKKKRVKKEHPILRFIFGTMFVLCSICLIVAAVCVNYVFENSVEYMQNPENLLDLDMYKANQAQTSIIYAYDANKQTVELLRLHGEENRVWVDYEDIPQDMIDAFRDLEDKRFEEHQGVDWKRTIGGVVKSGFEQGGSTITQQLIKNITGKNGRTVSRKYYEILSALMVEEHYHKNTIMEFYLNTVYLGNGCYGVKTAAEVYFGKNLQDLNAAECAVIASITQAPGALDPLTEPDANRDRQEYCLSCMLENGSITQAEYNEAIDFELIFTNSENYEGSQVTEDEEEDAADKDYTDEEIEEIEDSKKDTQSSYYVDYVIDEVIEDLMVQYDLSYNDAWKKVFFGGLRIYAAVDLDVQEKAEYVYENRITFPDEEDTVEKPAAQSAITIMDYNGRIVAMVGGAGQKDTFRGLNRAAQSLRQPGSSIKPLSVYAKAIDEDYITWSTMIQNYGLKMGSSRYPTNYGGSAGSATSFVTTTYALKQSLNTVPAQIARVMGLDECLDFLSEDLHFTSFVTDEDDSLYDGNYSTIACGGCSHGVSTLEMAAAYAMFGNNGYYFEPYSYYKVTNNDGTVVLLDTSNNTGERVIDESSAGVMRELLERVVTGGTGSGCGVTGFDTFAKTGTTSDDKDRWFCAGTPYYVAAVWYGYDEPRKISNVSGNPAGKIFKEIMNSVHADLEPMDFPTASGVVTRSYCDVSGCLASEGCANTSTGYYKSDNLPRRCDGCAIIGAIGAEAPDIITTTPTEPPSTVAPTKPPAPPTPPTVAPTAPVTDIPVTTEPPLPPNDEGQDVTEPDAQNNDG